MLLAVWRRSRRRMAARMVFAARVDRRRVWGGSPICLLCCKSLRSFLVSYRPLARLYLIFLRIRRLKKPQHKRSRPPPPLSERDETVAARCGRPSVRPARRSRRTGGPKN